MPVPRISVITPVYNGERFIAQAIDSVLLQTLSDWELIVVDDGSTDATPAILAGFDDPRIRVIRQENGGEASARNTGLDAAAGQYVAFLDADDLYFPNGLGDFATYLENHPDFDVVYSDGVMCDQDKKPLMRLSEIRSGIYEGHILEQLVLSSSVITVPACTALRREILEVRKLRFDTDLRYAVDWDLWIRLALVVKFGYLDRLTCQYRVHQNNMTSAVSSSQRKQDLLPSRRKVLDAPWFGQLALSTKTAFFYYILIHLLDTRPDQQQDTMDAPPFRALPANAQAHLLRLVASNHLSRRQDTEFAVQCLQRSLTLQPGCRKGRLLLRLADQSPSLAAATLSAWQVGHNVQSRIRFLGRRRPKPVPAGLLPAAD